MRGALLCAALVCATSGSGAVEAPGALVSITGTVLENRLDCRRDGPCLLVVRHSEVLWHVVYHPGEGEYPCLRPDLVRIGLAIRPGTTVHARGHHQRSGALERLDLCDSEAELRIVKPPNAP